MNLLVLTNNPERASFRQQIEVHLDILRDKGIESGQGNHIIFCEMGNCL